MTSAPPKKGGDAGDLEGSLKKMPFDVAHALARLGWHESWRVALTRAAGCSKEKPLFEGLDKALEMHKKEAKAAREGWAGLGGKWAEGPRGAKAGGEVVQALQDAAKAAAEHCANLRVYTCHGMPHSKARKEVEKKKEEAAASWKKFEAAMAALKEQKGVMGMSLRESTLEMLWALGWHAANTLGDVVSEWEDQQEDDDEDEDDEDDDDEDDDAEDSDSDEDAFFGEEYFGSSEDAVMDLTGALESLKGCFWDTTPFSGVRLDLKSCTADVVESELTAISSVPGMFGTKGLNAVRLLLPDSSAAKDPLGDVAKAALMKAQAAELKVVLDIPAKPDKKHAPWLKSLAKAVAPYNCVRGVALPAVGDDTQEAASLINAIRNGGLDAARCVILVPMPGGRATDDEDEWTEGYTALHKSEPSASSMGLLLLDGNVHFEVQLTFPAMDDGGPSNPQELLDAASNFREEASTVGVISSWSLAVPSTAKAKPASKSKTVETTDLNAEWYREYSERLTGSVKEAPFGHFFESWLAPENDEAQERSLKDCLAKSWVDFSSDVQTIQPKGGTHKASLVYLHGFTCDGYSYMIEPNYFYKPKSKPKKKTKGKKKSKDDDEDDEVEYEPIPGLKVVLPTAPMRKITAYGGEESYAWHDYLTDYDGEEEDELPTEDLEEQVARIHKLLDAEVERVGAQNVFVGGASQGCGVALHAALTYPGALGGVIGTMGHLLTCTEITADWIERKIPVFVYNGLVDTTMPWETWVGPTWQRLKEAGADVRIHLEEGADHGDAEDGWTRAFLTEVLRPATVKTVAKKKPGKK